jgi:hypothetical protein
MSFSCFFSSAVPLVIVPGVGAGVPPLMLFQERVVGSVTDRALIEDDAGMGRLCECSKRGHWG